MTWSKFISYGEDVLTLTALAAATYAGIEFVRGLRAARECKRAAQVDAWRKASVQKIVAKSEAFMTTGEITSALRSNSFDAPFDIRKNELTDDAVRLLMLDLVRDRVLGQVWPDSYGITQLPRDITLPVVAAGVRGNMAVRGAFALIHEHPGYYSDHALHEKLKDQVGLSLPDFVLAVSDLDARNVAKKGPDGKWSAVVNRLEGIN